MKFTKLLIATISIASMLSFTSCSDYERGLVAGSVATAVITDSARADHYYYNGYDYGYNRNSTYRLGVRHGCRTANGVYTKNRYKFNNYSSYRDGWYSGRNNCR